MANLDKANFDSKEKSLPDELIELFQNARREKEDKLYIEHSNLNAVGISSINSRKSDKAPFYEPCIVLYCSIIGFIPDAEDSFPKFLEYNGKKFPVDVREGKTVPIMRMADTRRRVQQEVKMGHNIKRSGQDKLGSIGPFVEQSDLQIYFLTCAHVLFPIGSNVGELMPEKDEVLNRVLHSGSSENENPRLSIDSQVCGSILCGYFVPAKGVDVAVVEISQSMTPIGGRFRAIAKNKEQNIGTH